jgi:serine/threonine-protein kinase
MSDNVPPPSFGSKYKLLEVAGEGGMAKVWLGVMRWASGFTRPVAVKQILPSLTANKKFVDMFVEEARVGSQLNHSNIVQTLDFGVDRLNNYYLVLEWVDGLDLRRYVQAHIEQEELTSWPLITAIGIEALRGLGAAHGRLDSWGRRAPVIHRDVTPPNILIGTNGIVKLTDFGLSRAKDRVRITEPKVIKGKLGYLCPELAWGQEATEQSDLYCLGLALWEALALSRAYQGKTDVDIFVKARQAEVPPIQEYRDDLPDGLERVLEQALAREPSDRYGTAQEMLKDLTAILRKEPFSTDAAVLSRSVIKARRALGLPPSSIIPPPLEASEGPRPLPPPSAK